MVQISNEELTFLKDNWNDFLNSANISNLGDKEFESIQQSYQGRGYHNLMHIKEALLDLEEVKGLLQNPLEIQMAIWYHDIIYDSTKPDNEEASARVALEASKKFGLDNDFAQRVHDLIIVTKGHLPSDYPDSKYLIDIDFGILGKDEARFNEYEKGIRKEYSQYSDKIYNQGRVEILKSFLDRESLYQTKHFRNKYEKNARKNIQGLIEKLQE